MYSNYSHSAAWSAESNTGKDTIPKLNLFLFSATFLSQFSTLCEYIGLIRLPSQELTGNKDWAHYFIFQPSTCFGSIAVKASRVHNTPQLLNASIYVLTNWAWDFVCLGISLNTSIHLNPRFCHIERNHNSLKLSCFLQCEMAEDEFLIYSFTELEALMAYKYIGCQKYLFLKYNL